MIGAFTLVHRLYKDRHVHVVGDSKLIYDWCTTPAKVAESHLVELVGQLRDKWRAVAGNVVLCHMMRKLGNPADPIADESIAKAQDIGDPSMFPPLPFVRPLREQRRVAPPFIERHHPARLAIETAADFERLR